MLQRLRVRLTGLLKSDQSERSTPELSEGEVIVREGVAAITRGMFGGRYGPLVLTNKRLLWQETGLIWPLTRQHRQVGLADVVDVDKGTLFDFIAGGRRLRLRLQNGKHQCFFEGDGRLDEWISAIQSQLRSAA